MGELRRAAAPALPRGPHGGVPSQGFGRAGTLIGGVDRGPVAGTHTDGEALLEDHRHLRASVAKLRAESEDIKAKVRKGEMISLEQDKQLQDHLSTARAGVGLPGEALDQLREDLQALLQFKRQAQECRQSIEEKETKMAAILQELRTTRTCDMEQRVAEAKIEAKRKADEWEEINFSANAGDATLRCGNSVFAESKRLQKESRELVKRTFAAESEVSVDQQKLANLLDEIETMEHDLRDIDHKIDDEKDKLDEIKDKKEADERLTSQENMQAIVSHHAAKKVAHGELEVKLRNMKHAMTNTASVGIDQMRRPRNQASARSNLKVANFLLQPGSVPSGTNQGTGALLRRFRLACALSGHSALEVLAERDADRDGFVSAAELMTAFSKLKVLGGSYADAESLVSYLGKDGYASIADLAFALQLQPAPVIPDIAELRSAAEALAWACRRRRVTEGEVRESLTRWLRQTDVEIQAEFTRFCVDRGVGRETALCLGHGLESRRELIAKILPAWRCPPERTDAAVCARFVKEITQKRDSAQALFEGDIPLDNFVRDASSLLGNSWSQDVLELVALLAEVPQARADAQPIVDGMRLKRATAPGGFMREFPREHLHCTEDVKKAVEDAASSASRRSRPGVASHTPPDSNLHEKATPEASSTGEGARGSVSNTPPESSQLERATSAVSSAVGGAEGPCPIELVASPIPAATSASAVFCDNVGGKFMAAGTAPADQPMAHSFAGFLEPSGSQASEAPLGKPKPAANVVENSAEAAEAEEEEYSDEEFDEEFEDDDDDEDEDDDE